jgi:hypothetical protein
MWLSVPNQSGASHACQQQQSCPKAHFTMLSDTVVEPRVGGFRHYPREHAELSKTFGVFDIRCVQHLVCPTSVVPDILCWVRDCPTSFAGCGHIDGCTCTFYGSNLQHTVANIQLHTTRLPNIRWAGSRRPIRREWLPRSS